MFAALPSFLSLLSPSLPPLPPLPPCLSARLVGPSRLPPPLLCAHPRGRGGERYFPGDGRPGEGERYPGAHSSFDGSGPHPGGMRGYVPPPIDQDRRNRSPGLSNNFYDVPNSDFKQPYGMGGGLPPAPPSSPPTPPGRARGRAPAAQRADQEREPFHPSSSGYPPPVDDRPHGMNGNFYEAHSPEYGRPHNGPMGPMGEPSPAGYYAGGGSPLESGYPMAGFEFDEFHPQPQAEPPDPVPLSDERSASSARLGSLYDPAVSKGAPPPPPASPPPPRDRARGRSPARQPDSPMSEPFQPHAAGKGYGYGPAPGSEARRTSPPGRSNFFDATSTDFKRPQSVGRGAVPSASEVPPGGGSYGAGNQPRDEEYPRQAFENGAGGGGTGGVSRPGEEPRPLSSRERLRGRSPRGSDSPTAREPFQPQSQPQAQSQGGGGGRGYTPPPIDQDRRSRSPGLSNNFYDVPISDFKKPHGIPRGVPSPPQAPPPAAAAPPPRAAAAPPPRAAPQARRGPLPPVPSPPGYGEESPMPGREKEYEAFKKALAEGGVEAYEPPPPIDQERRSRSPGLRNNFYDLSTADFKKPHGMPRGVPMPSDPPPPQAPAPSPPVQSPTGGGVAARAPSAPLPPPPAPAPIPSFPAPPGYGEESPMPGREKEYEAFKKALAEGGVEAYEPPPPIDQERRSRSPGLRNNFYDLSTADFKKPHGMPRGVPMPSDPPPPQAVAPPAPSPPPPPVAPVLPPPVPSVSPPVESQPSAEAVVRKVESGVSQVEAGVSKPGTGVSEVGLAGQAPTGDERAPSISKDATDGLLGIVSQLEQSNKRLVETLSDMRARDEEARLEAAEAKAREHQLWRRLAALELRVGLLSPVATAPNTGELRTMDASVVSESLAGEYEPLAGRRSARSDSSLGSIPADAVDAGSAPPNRPQPTGSSTISPATSTSMSDSGVAKTGTGLDAKTRFSTRPGSRVASGSSADGSQHSSAVRPAPSAADSLSEGYSGAPMPVSAKSAAPVGRSVVELSPSTGSIRNADSSGVSLPVDGTSARIDPDMESPHEPEFHHDEETVGREASSTERRATMTEEEAKKAWFAKQKAFEDVGAARQSQGTADTYEADTEPDTPHVKMSEEEGKKAWLARQGPPSWSKAPARASDQSVDDMSVSFDDEVTEGKD